MKRMLIVLCVLAVGLAGLQAHAEKPTSFGFYTGNDLYAQCFGNSAQGQLICGAYVMGSIDQLVSVQDTMSLKLGVARPQTPL